MRSVPLELALELKWNVLNSALVLPCLRGARLAETKDRVDWGLFGLTQVPASNALEVVSGKPLEPFNSTFGETRVQVPLGFWLPRSARMNGLGHPHGLPTGWWLARHAPVVKPSEHVRQPAYLSGNCNGKKGSRYMPPPGKAGLVTQGIGVRSHRKYKLLELWASSSTRLYLEHATGPRPPAFVRDRSGSGLSDRCVAIPCDL
jgi:hypothetical protein